jgi:hypothetical protein
MQLNAEKCKIMHLGKKNISSTYTMLDSSAGRYIQCWIARHLQYPQRLARFDLTNLETRRLRGDLIQLYKVNNGLDIVD